MEVSGIKKFISYDLGTGGVKASLYDEELHTIAKSFIEYETFYPEPNYHEQAPASWWDGVVESTHLLLKQTGVDPEEIACIALSGHSLVSVPIDTAGNELLEKVPIWSDTRAEEETRELFQTIDEISWYMMTGNGFPPACYSIFKLIWMKKHQPEVFAKTAKVLGSKDYINYKMTGQIYMDHSYASGTGAYDLKKRRMSREILRAADIPETFFPTIVNSDRVIGTLLPETAEALGLSRNTKVACGGVDNACMALGSVGRGEGRVYTSLGSSSWIAVNSKEPVLDAKKRPYVFAHIEEGMYTSAFSIFAGGSSLRWVRDNLCRDLLDTEDPYTEMTKEIEQIPAGSGGLIFNPSLAGGTSQDKTPHIQGAYIGLKLGTTRSEMIRASMEGIAMNLKMSLENLKQQVDVEKQIRFCGGGAKNPYWMQMFADIFQLTIVKTNIDQDAASLGAAAIAAKAEGVLSSYDRIDDCHRIEFECTPQQEQVKIYQKWQQVFEHVTDVLSDLGDYMYQMTK